MRTYRVWIDGHKASARMILAASEDIARRIMARDTKAAPETIRIEMLW